VGGRKVDNALNAERNIKIRQELKPRELLYFLAALQPNPLYDIVIFEDSAGVLISP